MNAQPRAVEAATSTPVASPLRRRRRGLLDRLFSPFTMTVYALALGLGLGLGSAYEVMRGDYPFGAARIGPWQTWPDLGSGRADPYARAILAKRGDVPLALGEGLALRATQDSKGQPLDAACTYRIGALMPPTRLWTLAAYDGAGQPVQSDLKRSGFTSAELLRNPDDTFAVVLSPRLQPGNWLKLPGSGPFTLSLRLYDMPGVAGAWKLGAEAMPSIERLECGA
jgi:hypothetical protein